MCVGAEEYEIHRDGRMLMTLAFWEPRNYSLKVRRGLYPVAPVSVKMGGKGTFCLSVSVKLVIRFVIFFREWESA